MSLLTRFLSFAQSRMPVQEFYVLDDLLVRWRKDGVSLRQIHEWVEKHDFVLGARTVNDPDYRAQFEEANGDLVTQTRRTIQMVGSPGPIVKTEYFDAVSLLSILTAESGLKISPPYSYSTSSRTPGTRLLRGEKAHYFSRADLVVCLAEVERIECKFGIGAQAPLIPRIFRKAMGWFEQPDRLFHRSFAASAVYLVGLVTLLTYRWPELMKRDLNELGDFVAGACAPLALLWLVVGFRLQAMASDKTEQDVARSTERQEATLDLMQRQASLERDRLQLERERFEQSLQPLFVLLPGRLAVEENPGVNARYRFQLINEGAMVSQVRVQIDPPLRPEGFGLEGVSSIWKTGSSDMLEFTTTKDAPSATGHLHIRYVRSDGRPGSVKYPFQVKPAEDDQVVSMPTIRFLEPEQVN